MKRIIVFWLVFLFPFLVIAKEFELKELDIKLNINDDFIVLTRDNLDNNSNLEKFNLSKEQMEEIMLNNNIYFDIVKDDISYEILIVVPNSKLPYNDLSKASSDELEALKKVIVNETGDNLPIIYSNKYSFVVVDYYDQIMDMNVINYYTVINHRGYNIQLQTKSEITDEIKNELKEIVDTIEFDVKDDNSELNNNKNSRRLDSKIIIIGAIIGAVAGLITYCVSVNMKKKKQAI